jgi:hypothetical protein
MTRHGNPNLAGALTPESLEPSVAGRHPFHPAALPELYRTYGPKTSMIHQDPRANYRANSVRRLAIRF